MAIVPFKYSCKKDAGFVMDPNEHPRVGYVIALNGFGLPATLAADLTVYLPFNTGAAKPSYKQLSYTAPSSTSPFARATVVGVIEEFNWVGGLADPITIDFYVSQENAMQILSLQQSKLKTTLVSSLSWWIADYDQEVKVWFEQAYPAGDGSITGHINGREDPALDVEPTPTRVKETVDVNVYKVKLEVVPTGTTTYELAFASSNQKKLVKSWGVVVGT
jgi:hypothetical protein